MDNAPRCPPLAHRSAAAHKLHSARPDQDKIRESQNHLYGSAFSLFHPGGCPNYRDHRISSPVLLAHVAQIAPDAVCCAIRYARMALNPIPARCAELEEIAGFSPVIHEQCQILEIFDQAHNERRQELEAWQAKLANLSPFELLIYASLHAFQNVVPNEFDAQSWQSSTRRSVETIWYATSDLLTWKLKTAPESSTKLSEQQVAHSIATHMSPFLFPSTSGPMPRHNLRSAYENLLAAQIELNEFISRSVDAYSYDESIRFVRHGTRLEIEVVNLAIRDKWQRDGEKLSLIRGYWFYRALEKFASSEIATQQIGSRENHEANRLVKRSINIFTNTSLIAMMLTAFEREGDHGTDKWASGTGVDRRTEVRVV